MSRLDASDNPLRSLEGLPTTCYEIELPWIDDLPLLRLLLVKDLYKLAFWADIHNTVHEDVAEIILRHAPQGRAGLSACATELIKAGYRGNAKL